MIVNFVVPKVSVEKMGFLGLSEVVLDPITKEWGGCSYHDVKGLWCENSESKIVEDDVVVVRVAIMTKYGSDEIKELVVKNWFKKLAHEVRKAFSQNCVYFEILNESTIMIVSEFGTTDSSIKPKPETKTISDIPKGASQ